MPPKDTLGLKPHLNENAKLKLRRDRFKEPLKDRLSFGLVSRGDSSLQSSAEKRTEFFEQILDTFSTLKSEQGDTFLNLSSSNSPLGASSKRSEPSLEIAAMLRRLRTLREALLAHKPDDFTKRVFLFSIRVAAPVRHYETYVASSLYLLNYASDLLTPSEEREISWILIVHTSHCNGDNYRALRLFFKHLSERRDASLYNLLLAWINADYHTWLQHFNTESDAGIHAIMTFGADRMMQHMISSVSSSYFTFPIMSVEDLLPRGEKWSSFKERFAIKWTEDETNLIVRPRGKPTKAPN